MARGELVAFPDDDCWYRPDVVRSVLRAFDDDPDLDVLSGRALTGDGRPCMLRWLDRPATVSRRNYYRTSVSFSLFMRRALFDLVGGFDEFLGAGAPGWYGSGEESDLVLRLLDSGASVRYRPDIIVHHDEPRIAATPAYVDKMLRYGCGQGLLWRRHGMARTQIGYLLARKVGGTVMHALRREPTLSRADLAYLEGCIAGLRGRSPRRGRGGAGPGLGSS